LSSKKLFLLISSLSFLLFFLRLSNLNIPPVLTVDEVSIGLNAQSIIKIGTDEWGQKLPLFFKAFGEYKSPIFIYSLIPSIALLSPTLYTIRLTSALWGLLTIAFAILLMWELTRNKTAALIAFVVSATLPWLYQLSHLGYEVITFPALFAAMLWTLTKSRQTVGPPLVGGRNPTKCGQAQDLALQIISAFLLGLTVYTYPTARLLVPLYFLIIICILIEKPLHRLLFSLTSLITITPFIAAVMQNPAIIFNRLNQISIFSQPAPLKLFLTNYFGYFSPQFLFLTGSPDILFSTQKSGALLISFLLPLLFGLILLCRLTLKQNYWALFILLGLVTFPLASALTFDNQPHLLRAANAIPFIVLTVTLGAWFLLKNLPKTVSAALIVGFILEAGLYFYDFNVQYPTRVLNNQAVKQIEVTGFKRSDLNKFYLR